MTPQEIEKRKSKVLTLKKKLSAIALKYYNHLPWNPKKGDYYTSSREDLELYIVVDVDDEFVYTEYTKTECTTSKWPKNEFLLGFGLCRVYVPDYVIDMEEVNEVEEYKRGLIKEIRDRLDLDDKDFRFEIAYNEVIELIIPNEDK
jgi:hypothetical protein